MGAVLPKHKEAIVQEEVIGWESKSLEKDGPGFWMVDFIWRYGIKTKQNICCYWVWCAVLSRSKWSELSRSSSGLQNDSPGSRRVMAAWSQLSAPLGNCPWLKRAFFHEVRPPSPRWQGCGQQGLESLDPSAATPCAGRQDKDVNAKNKNQQELYDSVYLAPAQSHADPGW